MAKINSINNRSSQLTIDPGASGDSYIQLDINSSAKFILGIDDDDGDSFKISAGSDLGANNTFKMTAAGERIMPLQSAFLAYLGTTDSNVTGNSTVFQVGSGNALTEVFDQNGDFNTNGTFTAPVTGRFYLNAIVLFDDLSATPFTVGNAFSRMRITTSNRLYVSGICNGGNSQSSGQLSINISIFADMDASDTATFSCTVSGEGADTVDVVGSATVSTMFCGYLTC